jgi:hypothetical protein
LNGKTFFLFLLFRQNLAALAGHHCQIFGARQLFSTFLFQHGAATGRPPLKQANPHPRGCSSGVPNYCNDLLIDIAKQLLPQGIEAWRRVALLFQNTSNERDLCRGEDICDNWVRKLFNNFKKLTGRLGNNLDQIFYCLEIERRIQGKANAAIYLATNLATDLATATATSTATASEQ